MKDLIDGSNYRWQESQPSTTSVGHGSFDTKLDCCPGGWRQVYHSSPKMASGRARGQGGGILFVERKIRSSGRKGHYRMNAEGSGTYFAMGNIVLTIFLTSTAEMFEVHSDKRGN